MRVGGSLGSEGTLSRVLRVLTCSRVSGYFDAQEYHDRASDTGLKVYFWLWEHLCDQV